MQKHGLYGIPLIKVAEPVPVPAEGRNHTLLDG